MFIRAIAWSALASFAFASPAATGPGNTVSLAVRDLTPKFILFYKAAQKENASEPRRWELWKKIYDFAAVPPTPEGDQMARSMLDRAWPQYPDALDRIEQGAAAIEPSPQKALEEVARILKADKPIRANLTVFVGAFDNNAFTAPNAKGEPTVALPVEVLGLSLTMTHEFTHVVEAEQAGLSLDWKRTVAQTIFMEGLAMRVTQALHPGMTDEKYTGEFTPNWYARCKAKQGEILDDIAPHLQQDDSAAIMRYTMGTGGAGVEREAYYAGWLVIGDLLKRGWTLPHLARVTSSKMPSLLEKRLSEIQLRHGKG